MKITVTDTGERDSSISALNNLEFSANAAASLEANNAFLAREITSHAFTSVRFPVLDVLDCMVKDEDKLPPA